MKSMYDIVEVPLMLRKESKIRRNTIFNSLKCMIKLQFKNAEENDIIFWDRI